VIRAVAAAIEETPEDRLPYKMKDLCELTGLPRQAIHFYIQQGLLPAGQKTGRNMAFYGDEHVERLKLIKRLQHERFLPLKAIKAMLDGREGQFTERQQRFLTDVRSELLSTLARGTEGRRATIDPAPLLRANGVSDEELDRLIEIGAVAGARNEDGSFAIAAEDAWAIENFGRFRAAGYTAELGFTVDDVAPYVEAIDALLRRDVDIVTGRLSHLPPATVARMLERALPLVQEILARHHARRVNDFLSTL
jgi:DNA-binding transcriptional MerR regulator